MGDTVRRPIKVMHVIARMNVGGPAVEITELMRGLDPDVVSQRLVTGYCDDDEADFLETQAPDVRATRVKGLGRTVRPTDDAFVLRRLVEIIRASRPDVVHTHTAKAGLLGRIAAKSAGTGTKVVHTHHGHLLHGYFGPRKTKAVVHMERQLSRITDRIVTVGEQVREDLLGAGIGTPKQYVVIRSGVRVGPLPDKLQARQDLALPDGPVIVSLIGRLTAIKRPDRFADVVQIVHERGLGAHFLVAGGGDQEEALRSRVLRDSLPVSMVGWRSDIERLLAATDILLLTSDNEGVPLSLIQASLAAIPLVASNVGAVHEIARDGINGLLAEPTAESLAAAVGALVLDRTRRQTLGESGRDLALREFSLDRMLAEHTGLYGGLSP